MALYAFDGTGSEDNDLDSFESNVVEFFRAYEDPLKNYDPTQDRGSLYLKGVGTRARTFTGDVLAEAFGIGGHRRVRQAVDRLQNDLEAGDTTIDIVGFSRGAALAVSFANEVAKEFPSLHVRFLGLWDLVGEFGVPGKLVNAGHDLKLPPNAEHCFHAMALDESRALFPLTRLGAPGQGERRLVEVWFRGTHSDIGGGNANKGLNWISLNWMFENAIRQGLPISPAAVAANLSNKTLEQQVGTHKINTEAARKILPGDLLHASVKLEPVMPGRTYNNPSFPLARIDDAGVVTSP